MSSIITKLHFHIHEFHDGFHELLKKQTIFFVYKADYLKQRNLYRKIQFKDLKILIFKS